MEATVKQYKLYLSKRLEEDHGVKASQAEIQLSVQGEVLTNDMTIGEVWKEMWGIEEDLVRTPHALRNPLQHSPMHLWLFRGLSRCRPPSSFS